MSYFFCYDCRVIQQLKNKLVLILTSWCKSNHVPFFELNLLSVDPNRISHSIWMNNHCPLWWNYPKIKTVPFYFFELFDVNWFVWLIWVKLSADGHQVSLSIWIMGLHHMEIIQNYKAIFDPVDANRIGFSV